MHSTLSSVRAKTIEREVGWQTLRMHTIHIMLASTSGQGHDKESTEGLDGTYPSLSWIALAIKVGVIESRPGLEEVTPRIS